MRKLAVNLCLLVVALLAPLVFAEISIRALGLFQRTQAAALQPAPELQAADDDLISHIIHPFLGWSQIPRPGSTAFLEKAPVFETAHERAFAETSLDFNAFGYRSYIDDYREVTEQDLVVGVFGGSVANHVAVFAGDVLIRELEHRVGSDRKVKILNLAAGSYKQPQQLITLVEMLGLGVPLDVVVNLDGFNEVAFGAMDSRAHRRHPIFPAYSQLRRVLAFSTGTVSPREVMLTADILESQKKVRKTLLWVEAHPWIRSLALGRTLVGGLVVRQRQTAARLEQNLQFLSGPEAEEAFPLAELNDPCLSSRDGCWDLIADLWAGFTLQMHHLSEAQGIEYLHFLQPNQYVPGSKPLTDRERTIAFNERSRFFRDIPTGYDHLRSRSTQLLKAGVDFHDLTGIFADQADDTYVDTCCHLNRRGNVFLAETIASRVEETLDASTSP